MPSQENENVLSSSTKLASYNMVLQLSFRILTFLLNAVTLRYISKDVLGVVNVRLTLLYSTILFLSREGFSRACLSKSPKGDKKHSEHLKEWRKLMNILWCIFPVGMVISGGLIYIWLHYLERPDPTEISSYDNAVLVFGISALLELLGEPLLILSKALLFVKLRVFSEGIPMMIRCLITVCLVVWFPALGIMAFAVGQAIFSACYVTIIYSYMVWYIQSGRAKKDDSFPFSSVQELLPDFSHYAIDKDTARLVWSFFKQSSLKQLLTEGERYVMTFFNVLSFGDQGVYDIVNNLGSLAARFIFLPIEESFYVFFAKMVERGDPLEKQDKQKMKMVEDVLFCLLRLVFLIGLIIFTFGFSYSYLFLHLYGGSILSTGVGPQLLQLYSFYVLLLAVNGTTECFFFAAMPEEEVNRYNKKMLLFSVLFLISSYVLTSLFGSAGFILANCLNMAVRIGHSSYFIHNFFRSSDVSPLTGVTPSPIVLLGFGIAFFICWLSESIFISMQFFKFLIFHIPVGAVCLFSLFSCLYYKEKRLKDFIGRQFFKKS